MSTHFTLTIGDQPVALEIQNDGDDVQYLGTVEILGVNFHVEARPVKNVSRTWRGGLSRLLGDGEKPQTVEIYGQQCYLAIFPFAK